MSVTGRVQRLWPDSILTELAGQTSVFYSKNCPLSIRAFRNFPSKNKLNINIKMNSI